jgi:hypothetical protein
MPSTIINIQSGHSHHNYYHVDPTMPAVLRSSGGVNEVEWKSFCDQVNARLDTFNKARQFSSQITSALCGVAILACVGIVAVMITNDPYDPYTIIYYDDGTSASASSGFENVALFFIIPAVLFVGACCVSCSTSNQSLKAYKDVHDICVEASKRNSNVSYHFRNTVAVQATAEGTHDRNIYIEVIFRDQMSVMQESPSNSYPTVSVAVLMTPEARLQQLEDMKHLLSAQEYDDKRSSILASV